MASVLKLVITVLVEVIPGNVSCVRRRVDRDGFDYREEEKEERRKSQPQKHRLQHRSGKESCVLDVEGRTHNVGRGLESGRRQEEGTR